MRYEVNEEEMVLEVEAEEEGAWGPEDDELDPKMVEGARREEVEFMVKKLEMFEFGTLEDAMRRGGKKPTTTRWVEGWKKGDAGGRFVRSRLVGRYFKVKSEGVRDDLFAAMPHWRRRRCYSE